MKPFLPVVTAVLALAACDEPRCRPGEVRVADTCYKRGASKDAGLSDDDRDADEGIAKRDAGGDSARSSQSDDAKDPRSDGGVLDAGVFRDGGSSDAEETSDAENNSVQPDAGIAMPAGKDAGQADAAKAPDKLWYRDCDADGFATSTAGGVTSLVKPQPATGCLDWTEQAPSNDKTRDCDDTSAFRHPGASFGLPIATSGAKLPAADSLDYDLDCDGQLLVSREDLSLSRGDFVGGKLRVIGLCPDTTMVSCTGGPGDSCVAALAIAGGGVHCGTAYTAEFQCSTGDIYFLCK